MAAHFFTKEELLAEIPKHIKSVEVLLDIGSGILPQRMVRSKVHICVDPHEEYVAHLQKYEDVRGDFEKSYVILNAAWEEVVRIFPPQSVDSVFLVDVIEHLAKEEVFYLLQKTEKIARIQVVLFTPLGFIPQRHPDGIDAWGLHGGKWQEHKSGWYPEDFDDSWECLVAPEYHYESNIGGKYEKPHGAFFAIKNVASVSKVDVGGGWVVSFADEKLQKMQIVLNEEKQKFIRAQETIGMVKRELERIYASRGWKIISYLHKIRRTVPFLKDL